MGQCENSNEEIFGEEDQDALIAEGCEVMLGRKPVNWKEEVQVLIYWANRLCPYTHLTVLPDLVNRAGFQHLDPNLIRNVSMLVCVEELAECIERHDCEKAKILAQRYQSSAPPPTSTPMLLH